MAVADREPARSRASIRSMASAVVRWALLPYWLLEVLSPRKTFNGNALLSSPALNRRGLHVWRVRTAGALTARRRRRLAGLVPEGDRQAFERDGFVVRPGLMSPDLFARVLEEVKGFRGTAHEFKEGDAVTRRIALTPSALRHLPGCAALVRLPSFQTLARYVSGFDAPPILYIQTVFSKLEGSEWIDPQTTLHRDTFHPVMKAWIYLQDMTGEVGPLTYAPGTHQQGLARLAWEREMSVQASENKLSAGSFRIAPEALPTVGGERGVRRFDVPANTLIVADTVGFHARAASDAPSMRVEIYACTRRRPFEFLVWPGIENLPGVGERLGAWGDRLEHLLSLRTRLNVPVRRVPQTTAFSPLAPWPRV